jgi:hypothetical protein
MQSIGEFLVYHLNPLPVIGEVIRMFPDAILWGVGLFSVLTVSYPFLMFFIALIGSLLIFYGIQGANTYLGIFSERHSKDSYMGQCKTGYVSLTFETLSIFGINKSLAFPSSQIYIIAVAISYLSSVMFILKNDLQALGTDYASRLYLSGIGMASVLVLAMIYRAFMKCDSILIIILSLILGLAVGTTLMSINATLFGKNSINVLGIPLLYNSTASGQPMYICNK